MRRRNPLDTFFKSCANQTADAQMHIILKLLKKKSHEDLLLKKLTLCTTANRSSKLSFKYVFLERIIRILFPPLQHISYFTFMMKAKGTLIGTSKLCKQGHCTGQLTEFTLICSCLSDVLRWTPQLLSLWWTIWLACRVSSTEGWVVLQFPVNPQYDWEWTQIHMKTPGIKDLRDQAAIGQSYVIPHTVLSSTGSQQFLNSSQSSIYPVLSPFFFLFFPNINENNQILKRLYSRLDDFTDLTYLSSLVNIRGHKWALRPGLFQVVHDVERLNNSVAINLQCRHLLHGIYFSIIIGMLLPSPFDQTHWLYVIWNFF